MALLLGITCLVMASFVALAVYYCAVLPMITNDMIGDAGDGSLHYYFSSPDQVANWFAAVAAIATPGVVGLLVARRRREVARVSLAGSAARFARWGLAVDGLLLATVLVQVAYRWLEWGW